MSEHESFEDRLRAMADEISRSVQRISEVDLEDVAARYGVDADRARTFVDAAGQWLSQHLSGTEPFFGSGRHGEPDSAAPDSAAPDSAAPDSAPPGASGDFDVRTAPGARDERPSAKAGPHPLDLPIDQHGLALSALDSGRWTVRPGSNQLAGTGEGRPPADAPDLVSELRARDWITADGTLTLVGRHALARWCRTAEDPARPAPEPDAPPEA
jgi:hypothetical protein